MPSSSTATSRPRAPRTARRALVDLRRWDPPTSGTPRGTVVVLPGRGEHAGVYERLGSRLAFDGYSVTAAGATDLESLRSTLADVAGPQPLVLIGSDAGALRAIILSGCAELRVGAVVAAGIPLRPAAPSAGWTEELEVRTACPLHRDRLTTDPGFRRGALSASLGDLLDRSRSGIRDLPFLAIHGEADELTPLPDVEQWLRAWPKVRLVAVMGGRHDVLNDLNHRSVAAEIVCFLERLRQGPGLPSVIEVRR